MRIALAQFNPTVSDIAGNKDRIIRLISDARQEGARVVLFSELCLCGYPPKDLVQRAGFVRDLRLALSDIAAACRGSLTAYVGFVEQNADTRGRPLFNALAECGDGVVKSIYVKRLLPTYDVFDESRHFEPGPRGATTTHDNGKDAIFTGLSICEDLWNDADLVPRPLYHLNPIAEYSHAKVSLVLNASASPFVANKQAFREKLFGRQAAKYGVAIAVCNQVGANDELVFDGASVVFDSQGRVAGRAKAFAEDLLLVDVNAAGEASARVEPYPDAIPSVHDALVLGTRDYMRKCGFRSTVLGLSGGIDSAVTACLAVEAIGSAAVNGVAMPSRFSSDHSIADAKALAERLGIRFDIIPIQAMHAAAEQTLAPLFAGHPTGVAEENVQARIRGVILMALSNKFGHLLLTTGNKSELAVGYCTLYGDMCGGLAIISDVPKTMVYELGREINRRAGCELIPQNTFDKPPSAELRPNQTDQDSLPPYDLLDAVLQRYVEDDSSINDIISAGFDPAIVRRVAGMVDRNEYKRQQAAPGLKVTSRAFGSGRRIPIARG